jgi:hypothetical protein
MCEDKNNMNKLKREQQDRNITLFLIAIIILIGLISLMVKLRDNLKPEQSKVIENREILR